MSERLDFVLGSVRGRRVWAITDGGVLTGVTFTVPWTLGVNTAECMRSRSAEFGFGWHGLPVTERENTDEPHGLEGCSCGFYAFYHGVNTYVTDRRARGVIEGFGEALIGTKGFRVTRARILALYLPETIDEEKRDLVRARYRAGIEFFDSEEAMDSAFPAYSGLPGAACVQCGVWFDTAELARDCAVSHEGPQSVKLFG